MKMAQAVAPAKKRSNPQQPIKVVCRIRPFSEQEQAERTRNVLSLEGTTIVKTKDKRYQFDKVFRPESTQMDIYLYVVSPMIEDVLSGYNCTVFAYGQTGTGKTFTMTGGDRDFIVNNWREDPLSGCIPRAAANIFDQITSMGTATDYNVRVSFLELYNEEVRDLLSEDERPPPLNVLSDTKGTVCIQGLREITVNNRTDIFELLDRGTAKRKTAATLMNHHSSRSHTVFTITVHARETSVTGEDVLKTGKINLVDLAGSENIAKSGAKDQRALELANINKSLLTLGRVIQNLVDKVKHVPYRDSKLTRILQDSLGGHTKTCIIATVSGAHTSYEETVSTLDYASRARDIKNYPTINEKFTKAQMMREMTKELEKLKKDLDAARSGQGFYIDKENWEDMQSKYVSIQIANQEKQERLHSLEEQIAEVNEVMLQKLRSFDEVVEDSKKFKSICSKQQILIKRQRLVIDREKFISNVYQTSAEEKGKECVWLIEQYNYLQKDYFNLFNKVDSLYDLNRTNEKLLKDTMTRFGEVMGRVSTVNNEYLQLVNDAVRNGEKKQNNIKGHCERYHEYAKVVKDSCEKLSKPFDGMSAVLSEENSPLLSYCAQTQADCENDIRHVESINLKLEEREKAVGVLLDELVNYTDVHVGLVKQQLDNSYKQLQEDNRKNVEAEEKITEGCVATLFSAIESIKQVHENRKARDVSDLQGVHTIFNNVGQNLDVLLGNSVSKLAAAKSSSSEGTNSVCEKLKEINFNKYHAYAENASNQTLSVAKTHDEKLRTMLSDIEPVSTLTDEVLEIKKHVLSAADSHKAVVENLKQVVESYSKKIKEIAQNIDHYSKSAMNNVKQYIPSGQTPKPTRTQLQHQGDTNLPPREVLIKKFSEEYSALKEKLAENDLSKDTSQDLSHLNDKENDISLSNCSAANDSLLNLSTELDPR